MVTVGTSISRKRQHSMVKCAYAYRTLMAWGQAWESSWGQHGAHLRPTRPKWAPCLSHELCCLGNYLRDWQRHSWQLSSRLFHGRDSIPWSNVYMFHSNLYTCSDNCQTKIADSWLLGFIVVESTVSRDDRYCAATISVVTGRSSTMEPCVVWE